MFRSFHMRTVGLALMLVAAAGCSSKNAAIYEHENFDDSGTFSRTYPVSDTVTCEAGRRALLSQGYIITSSDPKLVSGHKSFQQTGDTHMEISFNLVCAEDGGSGHHATMFANALQDRYALKKINNSASLGVGVLGSVSMPIGSSDDSMVKVASETVSATRFYERFFALVEMFLPAEAKKGAPIAEKPDTELGVPEPKAETAALTPAPEPAAPVEQAAPAPAPAEVAPAVSEPVAPPPEPAPIAPSEPAPYVGPESTLEVVTPPPPSDLPPPTEAIQPLPSS
ncbi:DUF2242 domain-containing protein [Pseudomonas sp. B21-028]|uniref:DUF2242 domain-containing protein n=1 Tax=Pseudomonas sp. B21-028 TaxID=2895480 RepID=UPI00215E6E5F|nr:DUF2242 domain-containing protein [Pseudomonas sp. B21-028]UVL85849.1 DUF2242 domain-containing protein [Pseudomonas sp. B21-028]